MNCNIQNYKAMHNWTHFPVLGDQST